MFLKRAIRKMFITTMSLFIIFSIYLIPLTETKQEVMEANLEIEYVTGLGNHSIYLLNKDQNLVKTRILLDSKKVEENIKTIIKNLTISNTTKFPEPLIGVIPKNTKLLAISIKDKIVTLNFSKEFLKVEEEMEEKLMEAIVYSITELKEIEGVKIKVENKSLTTYPSGNKTLDDVLTRKIGINKRYEFTTIQDINKVTIYYTTKLDQNNYYVPVTKYINDARDKVDIIVEELTTGYIYEDNLMSLVNEDLKLLNARKEDDLFILNFNNALFDVDGTIKEEVLYTISYSMFDNYDVSMLSFQVEDKEVMHVKRKDLP